MAYYYRMAIMGSQHDIYFAKSKKPMDLSSHPRIEGKDVAICEIAQDTYRMMVHAARMK